jgi:enoyl-CoA hydratase
VVLSEYFPVAAAREAGFFDELVPPDQLMARAVERAKAFAELNMQAHAASKRRIRKSLIRYVRCSVYLDLLDAILMGLRGAKPKSKVG